MRLPLVEAQFHVDVRAFVDRGGGPLGVGEAEPLVRADELFTVETSLLWGIVGVALIILVIVGLGYVFRRYGRR